MEHYLQQLDKINQYLDFTDVNAFPICRFVGSHLGVVIGLMALATFGHIIMVLNTQECYRPTKQ